MQKGNTTVTLENHFEQQLETLFQLWSTLSGDSGAYETEEEVVASIWDDLAEHPPVQRQTTSKVSGGDIHQLLVEHSFQGLAIVQNFDIVYTNSMLSQITGYSLEEMRLFSAAIIATALRAENRARAWQRLVNYLVTGTLPPRLELCFPHRDGSVRWAETYARGVTFRGHPTVLVTCVDITQRKEMELELQHLYGTLELRVRERAEALATTNGALQAEIIERRQAEEALQRAHNELETRVQQRTEELAKVNEALQCEIAERKQIEAALRRSEELFRALSENAADIISVIAGDRAIRYESPSIKRLLGYEPEELIGQNAFDYIHPDDRERVQKVFEETIATPGATRSAEFRFRHKDGAWRILESIGKNLLDNPIIDGLVVHSRDITRRKQNEDEKARLLEKVQKQHEQLRALAEQRRLLARKVILAQEEERHRVSRELHDEAGQALTALKVSLEMMLAELPPNADQVEEFRFFRRRMAGALALCETTMSQIRILAHDLRPAALDDLGLNLTLEGFCRDFVERTQLRIDYIGQELPTMPGEVEICLYRFLQEALTNVTKHARARRVVVQLEVQGEWVTLSVADDGQGFDHSTIKGPQHVVKGIGLLGMQERLESLGGCLKIETAPGKGVRLSATVACPPTSLARPAVTVQKDEKP